MLNFSIQILAVLIGITLIIGIHELGHLVVAKFYGVKVLRFSIGFGRPIWKCTMKETEYVIGIFPIGGYVRLLDEREGNVKPEELHRAFNRQSWGKRFWIIFAGPLFNLLFAWFAFWLVFVTGIYFVTPKVGEVVEGSIAAQAGIKPLDRIIQIDNQAAVNWGTITATLALKYGDIDKLTITVIPVHQKEPITHVLNLAHWSLNKLQPNLVKSLGIIEYHPKPSEKEWIHLKLAPIKAIGQSCQQIGFYLFFNLVILWKMITGVLSLQSLNGPISIVAGLFGAIRQGFLIYTLLLGWLSVNLATVNILPIPGLDGSHILYSLIEGIFRKPVSTQVQQLALRIGIMVLLFLILQALLNDIARLFTE